VTPKHIEVFTNSTATPNVGVLVKLPDGQYTQSGKEIIKSKLTNVPLYLSTAVIKLCMTKAID
jgi:hypothetical protein